MASGESAEYDTCVFGLGRDLFGKAVDPAPHTPGPGLQSSSRIPLSAEKSSTKTSGSNEKRPRLAPIDTQAAANLTFNPEIHAALIQAYLLSNTSPGNVHRSITPPVPAKEDAPSLGSSTVTPTNASTTESTTDSNVPVSTDSKLPFGETAGFYQQLAKRLNPSDGAPMTPISSFMKDFLLDPKALLEAVPGQLKLVMADVEDHPRFDASFTYYEAANRLWFLLAKPGCLDDMLVILENMEKSLLNPGLSNQPLKEITLGMHAVYADQGAGRGKRVQIIVANQTTVAVRFLDSGEFSREIPRSQLFELPACLAHLPQAARVCSLEGVEYNFRPREPVKFKETLLGKLQESTRFNGELTPDCDHIGALSIRLFPVGSRFDLNSDMAKYGDQGKPYEIDRRTGITLIGLRTYDAQCITLRSVNVGDFWLDQYSACRQFIGFTTALANKKEQLVQDECFHPDPKCVMIANINGQYRRVRILGGDAVQCFSVVSVDKPSENLGLIQLRDLYQLDDSTAKFPVLAVRCEIEDVYNKISSLWTEDTDYMERHVIPEAKKRMIAEMRNVKVEVKRFIRGDGLPQGQPVEAKPPKFGSSKHEAEEERREEDTAIVEVTLEGGRSFPDRLEEVLNDILKSKKH